jgi:ABC-type multidrug transport system fused ATPase/permease subunit
VVGPTGAGKSTLLALLQRFYDPEAGAIELDGADLRDLELGSLRRQLALVPQDPWMLDGSIADNIAFGKPGAGAEELEAAARVGLVNEIIARLPDGWNAQIGEGGVRLSEGQRRRVALARAILRTPRCCCWTSRPAGWTRPPSTPCSTPSTGRPRGGRCWPSPTG